MIEWEQLKNVDIRSIEKKDLVDITKIEYDLCEDTEIKINQFVKAVKNPYCFLVGDIAVKSSFTGTISLKQRLQEVIDGL